MLLGNRGLLNQILAAVGLPPLQLVHNKVGVVIGVVHFLLPFFVLALLGTIKNIPVALEDVARNLGAAGWRVFVHVTLPLSLPGLITTCSLTFVGALSAFLFPELLGGGRTHMAATIIYQRIVTNYNVPEAAAMAALFLLLSWGCWAAWACSSSACPGGTPSARATLRERPRPYAAITAVIAGAVMIFVLLPVVFIVLYAFNQGAYLTLPPKAPTLRWFESFFASRRFVAALWSSLGIAGVVTPVATLVAVPTARALVRHDFPGKATFNAISARAPDRARRHHGDRFPEPVLAHAYRERVLAVDHRALVL